MGKNTFRLRKNSFQICYPMVQMMSERIHVLYPSIGRNLQIIRADIWGGLIQLLGEDGVLFVRPICSVFRNQRRVTPHWILSFRLFSVIWTFLLFMFRWFFVGKESHRGCRLLWHHSRKRTYLWWASYWKQILQVGRVLNLFYQYAFQSVESSAMWWCIGANPTVCVLFWDKRYGSREESLLKPDISAHLLENRM